MSRHSLAQHAAPSQPPVFSRESIRTLQRERGEEPCYQTDWRCFCDNLACEWRQGCRRLVAEWRR